MIDVTPMLVDSFLDYLRYERNYSESTISSYRIDLAQFRDFVRERGLFVFSQVTSEDIRDWMVSMMDNGLAATYVNRKLSALRSFSKYLLRTGAIEIDPVRKIVGPKKKKVLPVFLKESDMNRLLDETDFGDGFIGSRDKLVVAILYATGMRKAEIVGIDDSDIDFSASTIRVLGKRNKQRLIPFYGELKGMLHHYMQLRNQEVPEREGSALLVKPNGKRLSDANIYTIVKQNLSKVVTLKKRSPHVLRHTFATTMLNNDAELGAVKEILGHASLAATEVYTHTTFEELKKVYKQAHPRS